MYGFQDFPTNGSSFLKVIHTSNGCNGGGTLAPLKLNTNPFNKDQADTYFNFLASYHFVIRYFLEASVLLAFQKEQ
jgi:hypothetical protein